MSIGAHGSHSMGERSNGVMRRSEVTEKNGAGGGSRAEDLEDKPTK